MSENIETTAPVTDETAEVVVMEPKTFDKKKFARIAAVTIVATAIGATLVNLMVKSSDNDDSDDSSDESAETETTD